MGICDSCMHGPEEVKSNGENECRWYDYLFKGVQHSKSMQQAAEGRTSDSSDLKNKAKENGECTPPAKVEHNVQSSPNAVQNSSLTVNSSSSQVISNLHLCVAYLGLGMWPL